MARDSIQNDLLDFLVDGASSFAALYGDLTVHGGHEPGIGIILKMTNALREMEQENWVRAEQMAEDGSFHEITEEERASDLVAYQAWLPGARFEELSVDEVGLWYELTPEGREEWKRLFFDEEQERQHRWSILYRNDDQTVVVKAQSIEMAEEQLRKWLLNNPEMALVSSSRNVEPISSFTLHGGSVVNDGVKLTYHCQLPGDRPIGDH